MATSKKKSVYYYVYRSSITGLFISKADFYLLGPAKTQRTKVRRAKT